MGVEYNPTERMVAFPPLPSDDFKNVKVLLASNSPRRRELLGLIVPEFSIAEIRDVKETYPPGLDAHNVPAYLSRLKASAYIDALEPDELIITADTVVLLDNEILGKPRGRQEAVSMLGRLSGRTHTVVTGVTLTSMSGKKSDTFSEETRVTFGMIERHEIEEYVDRFKPFDKAGAYGIQEWVGAAAIKGINGCFYNVMGLPLHTLYVHLKDFFRQE